MKKTARLSHRLRRAHYGPPAQSCTDEMTGGGWGEDIGVWVSGGGLLPVGWGCPTEWGRKGWSWALGSGPEVGGFREQLVRAAAWYQPCPGFEVTAK